MAAWAAGAREGVFHLSMLSRIAACGATMKRYVMGRPSLVPRTVKAFPVRTTTRNRGARLSVELALVALSACAGPDRAGPPSFEPRDPAETHAESRVPAAIAEATHRLEQVSTAAYEDTGGQQHVSGRVRNLSDATLQDVDIRVWWYTDWLDFVTTREGHLDVDPLPPGEIASFDIAGPVNPYASKFLVELRSASGDILLTVDRQ